MTELSTVGKAMYDIPIGVTGRTRHQKGPARTV
jgi:hypothetical protein